MKKFFTLILAAAAALVLSFTTASAEEVPFQSGFQYSLGVGATATPSADASFGATIGAPYAGLAATWDFCAPLAVRVSASYAQAKSSYQGASRSWGFQHAMLSADLILDVCNCFRFKETRGFNPYLAVGYGIDWRFGNTMSYNEAKAYNEEHLCSDNCRHWTGTVTSYAFRASAGMEARVNDAVRIYLELTDNLMTDRFNSLYDHIRIDQHLALQVGVKLTLGQARKYRKAHADAAPAVMLVPVPVQPDNSEAERLLEEARKAAADAKAAREAADRARAEAEALLAQAKAQVQQGITIAVSNPLFKIGKADLNDAAKANLRSLADALKTNPQVSIDICGYADRQTGNPELNWSLSRRRAEAVLDALTYYGVPAAQVRTAWKGDTEAVSETQELNRTVTITIAE